MGKCLWVGGIVLNNTETRVLNIIATGAVAGETGTLQAAVDTADTTRLFWR